jgi:hypothetical protein
MELSLSTILSLLPLAITAFGDISQEVIELKAASGLSDDELLAAAQATDATTAAAIQKHLDALALQS